MGETLKRSLTVKHTELPNKEKPTTTTTHQRYTTIEEEDDEDEQDGREEEEEEEGDGIDEEEEEEEEMVVDDDIKTSDMLLFEILTQDYFDKKMFKMQRKEGNISKSSDIFHPSTKDSFRKMITNSKFEPPNFIESDEVMCIFF